MTMAARTFEIGTELPSQEVSASARKLSQLLHQQFKKDEAIEFESDGTVISIEPDLAKFLMVAMDHLKEGQGVTLVPVTKRLTTQQAADILNVSRPYLIKLLDAGDLPFDKIGRHRRILASDLFDYQRKRDQLRDKAMSELLKSDGDLY